MSFLSSLALVDDMPQIYKFWLRVDSRTITIRFHTLFAFGPLGFSISAFL